MARGLTLGPGCSDQATDRVLIVGRESVALAGVGSLPPGCKVICVSPAVAEILAEAGVPHASVPQCQEAAGWEEIHRRIGSVLSNAGRASPTPPSWQDDWSHLIADEARIDFFWLQTARRIAEVDCPSAVLVQDPDDSHPSAEALRAIATAFELLGVRVEWWRG